MHDEPGLVEVKRGTLETFEGESHAVEGGVYLAPQEYLRMNAELSRLKERTVETSMAVPVIAIGAALLGLAAGYWWGSRGDDEG